MNHCAKINIYIDVARFVPTNTFFKNSDITKERTVSCYELVLFLKDGGYAVINGKKYPIKAGSVRFHRPGDKVYSHRFNEIYVIHFNVNRKENCKDLFKDIPPFITLTNFENEIDIIKKLITALLEQDDFECFYSLLKLLSCIKTQFCIQQKNSKGHVISQIKKHIDDHYSNPLTLEEIAKIFYMHPVYIQRIFKKNIGKTPSEYIRDVRLSKSKAYLLTTDLTVDHISELCGFCNTSYFISTFKKSVGLTPFKYRQEAKMQKILL